MPGDLSGSMMFMGFYGGMTLIIVIWAVLAGAARG